MARSMRCDGPEVWHHVMNRGIARRTVFEDTRDVRFFLACLARAIRAGRLEVHAYCILTTHFHLLVRSTEHGLSRAMCRVTNDYVRWFNRSRRRDGPLFRGRFRSRPVRSLEYRFRLIQYIDANPVLAGLVETPGLYPHGSARWYARKRGPIWLHRRWIEDEVRESCGAPTYAPGDYRELFAPPIRPALARVIERRIESGSRAPDALDDLLGAAPARVLAWMRHKAFVADGTCIDLPVCDPDDVCELVSEEREGRSAWRLEGPQPSGGAWQLIGIALLRDLCGLAWAEIGARMSTSDQGAIRAYRRHGLVLETVTEYAEVIARLASTAIARCYGERRALSLS